MTDAITRANFDLFIHSLATEFDQQAGEEARDMLLRAVGRRMAARIVPPPCAMLEALEIELNDLLSDLGWGRTRLVVEQSPPALRIVHDGLPRIGALGTPPGEWLQATLEGLYEGWIGSQPDALAGAVIERVSDTSTEPGQVVLRLQVGGAATAGPKTIYP